LQLQWHKNKELHISSPTQKEKAEILHEITQERVMLFTPMEINTMEATSMDKELAKESIYTPMAIDTKEPSKSIRSMESDASQPKIRVNTMVHIETLRSMGKRSQAWIGDLRLCQQRFLQWMVAVRKETWKWNIHLC